MQYTETGVILPVPPAQRREAGLWKSPLTLTPVVLTVLNGEARGSTIDECRCQTGVNIWRSVEQLLQ